MKQRRFWCFADDWMVRAYYPHLRTREIAARVGHSYSSTSLRARNIGVRKTSAFMLEMLQQCGAQAVQSGAATRFCKGIIPSNKGLRRPGYSIGRGRMRETQFRKGGQPLNTMPLWSFRWADGYLMLKTGARHAPPNDRWEYVHKLIWEQAKGPLPDWRVARLWWKDGDHGNCALSNLELVSAQEHMARTTIHTLPAPLKAVIQLKGALKRRIRRMENDGEEHDGRSPQSPVCDDRSLEG
jgi:hypothetical protein